jgi:hypothetical protein
MAVPALRIPLSLNMEQFNKNISSAKSVTSEATQFIAKRFVDMNASLLATQGAAGGAVLALRSVVGVLAPLALAVTGIVGVFKLMGYATELAKEKIEEFNEIAEKAGKANVSTDFFQRFTKSGEQLKLTVEEVTEALNRFANASKDALGGSELSQRVAELQKLGNFEDNSGPAALSGSADTETRLRATVQLIQEAFDAGQRLAGLDIADKAFGRDLTNRLRQDAGLLEQMLETADKMAASKIISEEQVGQAIHLKTRLEEAEKVLAERFKPIQDDLAKLGVQYHQSWIEIVELMASAVGKANTLYDSLKGIPEVLADAGRSTFWTKLTEASERAGLNSRPAGLILPGEPGFADPAGFAALRSGLNNPNSVRQAMQSATQVQSAVRGDSSIAPKKKEIEEAADAYDRAVESITKHTARQQADAAAVGLGAGALEEYRAKSQLTSAALQAEIPITDELTKKIEALAKAAGEAGKALAESRVAGEITFGQRTAFLSQEDVAVAQQLRGIYGNDIPKALASSQAAALRMNDATREIASTISSNLTSSLADVFDGTKTASQGFTDFAKVAIRAIEETIIKLLIVGPLMRSLQSGLGGIFGGGELPGFGTSSFVGPQLAAGGVIPAGGVALVSEHSPGGGRFVRAGSEPIMVTPNDIAPRSGGGGLTVNLIEDSNRAGQVEKRDNGAGGFDAYAYVDSITAKNAANPGSATSQVLSQRNRLASR